MKKKIWNKAVIATEVETIEICPTEDYTGIIVETRDLDGKKRGALYLHEHEMELFITKMQEMMKYVLEK